VSYLYGRDARHGEVAGARHQIACVVA